MRDDDDGHGSPRRYLFFNAAGAIAIRLPATSSRTYTSSVSDPLAKTSKTEAASSVSPGRPSIMASTSVRASLMQPPPDARRPVGSAPSCPGNVPRAKQVASLSETLISYNGRLVRYTEQQAHLPPLACPIVEAVEPLGAARAGGSGHARQSAF